MLYSSFCSVDWENSQRSPSDRQRPLSFGVTLHEFAHLLVQGGLLNDEFGLAEADAHFVLAAAGRAAARSVQWRHDVFHSEAVEAVCRKHLSSVLRPLFLAFSPAGPAAPPPEAPFA